MELIKLLWLPLLGICLLSFNFSLIGTTLVEKKLSLIGESFSHALLPGVVLAVALQGAEPQTLLLGGWISGLLLFFASRVFTKLNSGSYDSNFAFVSLFFVAAGMVLSFETKTSSEILHLLLGNAFAIDQHLVITLLAFTLATWTVFFLGRHVWSLWILDPDFQFPKDFRIRALQGIGLFLFVSHLTLGLYCLGALMTAGLLVIPSLISALLFHRLYDRVLGACVLSLITNILGLWAAAQLDWPIGPSLVLMAGFLYVAILVLKSRPSGPSRAL